MKPLISAVFNYYSVFLLVLEFVCLLHLLVTNIAGWSDAAQAFKSVANFCHKVWLEAG